MSRWLRRRLLADRVVAAVLGVVVLPIVALIAALVHRDDGGPGTIALTRIGRHGRPFALCKLRTMSAVRPDGAAGGAPLTLADDPRLTRIGRRLRHPHLDELPQLLNVVRGEMSLIGPRPEASEYVDLTDARWRAVLQAPPGIAGPTQLLVEDWEAWALAGDDAVRTYREAVLPVKLAVDAWYVANASPWLDGAVAWSLVQRIVLRRRVTAIHRIAARATSPELRAAAARMLRSDNPTRCPEGV